MGRLVGESTPWLWDLSRDECRYDGKNGGDEGGDTEGIHHRIIV